MASVLDELLKSIDNPELAARIRTEFDKTTKDFGLVFERHQQEGVRMPKAPVVPGAKVIVEADDSFHTVVAVDGDTVTLSDRAGNLRDEPLAGVTVAREFGDTMYPGLTPVAEIRRGKPGDPVHTIINGENYHALEMLQYTHAEKVDLIYIDPPYNTGNKTWKYNDRYVAETDSYRHSKWLSFMERRLELAKKLLKPAGVIIVAIGDDEHHRLRMLMDQVFGAGNFIMSATWQGGGKNNARFTSGGVDHMLIYAASRETLSDGNTRWLDIRPGAAELAQAGLDSYTQAGGELAEATTLLRAWIRENRHLLPGTISSYRTVWRGGSVVNLNGDPSAPSGNGLRYEVRDPSTGVLYATPKNGWRLTQQSMEAAIAAGDVYFPKSPTSSPQFVRHLNGQNKVLPAPTFYVDRRASAQHLQSLLGDARFPFPKDHTVLMRWFRMVAPKDAVILDFFGGSGTTAEAVMRLNAEDGGTRQAILVTNNELSAADDKQLRAAGHGPGDPKYEELGVFHHVTRPRIETVITGIRPDGTKYSDGLAANAAFFDLEYLDRARVKYGNEFDRLAPVFWLRAAGHGPLVKRESLAQGFAFDPESALAVLFRPGRASQLAAAIAAAPNSVLTHLFIVTDSDEQGNVAAGYFDKTLTIERIYGSYLSAFQINQRG